MTMNDNTLINPPVFKHQPTWPDKSKEAYATVRVNQISQGSIDKRAFSFIFANQSIEGTALQYIAHREDNDLVLLPSKKPRRKKAFAPQDTRKNNRPAWRLVVPLNAFTCSIPFISPFHITAYKDDKQPDLGAIVLPDFFGVIQDHKISREAFESTRRRRTKEPELELTHPIHAKEDGTTEPQSTPEDYHIVPPAHIVDRVVSWDAFTETPTPPKDFFQEAIQECWEIAGLDDGGPVPTAQDLAKAIMLLNNLSERGFAHMDIHKLGSGEHLSVRITKELVVE